MRKESLVVMWRWVVESRRWTWWRAPRRQITLRLDLRRWCIGVGTSRWDGYSSKSHGRFMYVAFGPVEWTFWKKVG